MVNRIQAEERLQRMGVPFDNTSYGVLVYFTEPGDSSKTDQVISQLQGVGMRVSDVDLERKAIAFSDTQKQQQGMGVSL